jgi:hypothetical protein
MHSSATFRGLAMNECRLCAAQTKHVWRHMVLEKYDVGYFECEGCGSLQTEAPYWLEEAYSEPGTGFDTGACQRSIQCVLAMTTALEFLGYKQETNCLDYGAGVGLYARMMRDRGWNYFAHDKYSFPFYMDEFRADPKDKQWGIISAFEVFEHLPDPAEVFDLIAGSAVDYVFFTTDLWEGQGRDWQYLAPFQGQHVFFYTQKALELVARKYGYNFHNLGLVKCFARPNAGTRLSIILQPEFGRMVLQSFVRHQQNPYQYALKDNAAIQERRNGAKLNGRLPSSDVR